MLISFAQSAKEFFHKAKQELEAGFARGYCPASIVFARLASSSRKVKTK